MKYSVSRTGIDAFLYDVKSAAYKKLGNERAAENAVYALVWYISTSRASVDFIKSLFTFSPRVIANNLLKGGSDQEKVERLKKSIARKGMKAE